MDGFILLKRQHFQKIDRFNSLRESPLKRVQLSTKADSWNLMAARHTDQFACAGRHTGKWTQENLRSAYWPAGCRVAQWICCFHFICVWSPLLKPALQTLAERCETETWNSNIKMKKKKCRVPDPCVAQHSALWWRRADFHLFSHLSARKKRESVI